MGNNNTHLRTRAITPERRSICAQGPCGEPLEGGKMCNAQKNTLCTSCVGNPGAGKINNWGLGGVWRTSFTVDFIRRVARKLCRVVLAHFGPDPFRFHFGKPGKSRFSSFSDLVDVSTPPNTSYLSNFEDTRMTPRNSRKNESFLEKIMCGHLNILDIEGFANLENARAGNSWNGYGVIIFDKNNAITNSY